MRPITWTQFFISAVIGIASGLLLGAAVVAHETVQGIHREEQSFVAAEERPVKAIPESAPRPSQESINLAMEVYNISMPPDASRPRFEPQLTDRGQTIRKSAFAHADVLIGSEAFSSWGMLGSTLAHEIEVHCRQNFIAVHLLEISGFDGVGDAEREAYLYELRNSRRFGLSVYDQDLIRATMNDFYPTTRSGSLIALAPLKLWLETFAAQTRSRVSI